MAQRFQITCIRRPGGYVADQRIQRVGGVGWSLSLDEAIQGIEQGRYAFYVKVNGSLTDVYVVTQAFGFHKYLETVSDTTTRDNLLSLPECPQ